MKHINSIVGYTRKGRPVYAIAGGSGEPPPAPQAPAGDTITVQEGDRPAPSTEEPPAQPAPTRAVDPGAFNRGVDEQFAADGRGGQQAPQGQRQPTWEDVERARQQEKDKLYGEIESLKSEQQKWREEREAEQRARDEEEARATQAAREAEESDLDVRELIQRKEQEWNSRFDEVRSEAEKAQAMLEQERRFNALQEFKRQQLEAHEDEIMPHLRGYVSGNTEEEIQASIQQQIQTTQAILSDVQAAQQQQRQVVPGTRVTAPGDGGPIEQTQGSTRNFSAQDISQMSPAEYAKYRDQLLGAAARQGPYGGR